MRTYHKINTIFQRDVKGNILEGQYSTPEIEYLKDNDWVWTEKIDGTNIRVGWSHIRPLTIDFMGRNNDSEIPTFLVQKLSEIFDCEEFSANFKDAEIILCGEGYGDRIQKAGSQYIKKSVDFILFDVIINNIYLKRVDVEEVARKLYLDVVPIVGHGTLSEAVTEIKNLKLKSQFGDFLSEGIVLKPTTEMYDRVGHRIVTKLKHKDFYKEMNYGKGNCESFEDYPTENL